MNTPDTTAQLIAFAFADLRLIGGEMCQHNCQQTALKKSIRVIEELA